MNVPAPVETVDLVLPNIAEFTLRHPRLALHPAAVDGFARFGRAMSDQSVFWSSAPRILVLPDGVDAQWLADVHRVLGEPIPPLICPRWRSGLLTADLLDDPAAMSRLGEELRGYRRVRFVSWGATEQLYRLSATLRSLGHEVELDVPDEEHYWSSLYLDSKMSCLDLASQVPELRVAPGVTVDTWHELRGVVETMTAAGQRLIVRSMYGSAGEGATVVEPDPAGRQRFWAAMRDDSLLSIFPLTVQHYLPHHPEVACPAVDMLISGEPGEDAITDLVPSVMTVDSHRFVSVNVGHGLTSSDLDEQMTQVARRVADAASRLGFRGWFGIDFLVDRQGELYVTEFNARRTGGTQWIPLLDRYEPPRRAVAHLQHVIPVPAASAGLSYAGLRPAFEPFWAADAMVLPVAVRDLNHETRPSYGIVTADADAARAERHAQALRDDVHARLTASSAVPTEP